MVRWIALFSCVVVLLAAPALVTLHAQELVADTQTIIKAEVIEVLTQEERLIPGTDTTTIYQKLRAEILDGSEKGKIVTIENDYLQLSRGEIFYLMHTISGLDNSSAYTAIEPYRLPALLFFVALFVIIVVLVGGAPGLRGLLSLVASLFFIYIFLLPGILKGYSPILVAIGVSSLIVILGSYVTHGFSRMTSAAVLGMIVTICITGLIAHIAVGATRLGGLDSDEAVYLTFNTRGTIDLIGILLGGILIGLLGVLYDAAIGQSVSVEELYRANPELSRSYIFTRAMRMGREHIGALVNTLAIAYVGASLPLLLIFYASTSNLAVAVNREIFAAEIVRTAVGSIGLILAVPITTAIAVWMLVRTTPKRK